MYRRFLAIHLKQASLPSHNLPIQRNYPHIQTQQTHSVANLSNEARLLLQCSKEDQGKKTYNSGYSPMVTHLTTNPPVTCLSTPERTGWARIRFLWSYVLGCERHVLCIAVQFRWRWCCWTLLKPRSSGYWVLTWSEWIKPLNELNGCISMLSESIYEWGWMCVRGGLGDWC